MKLIATKPVSLFWQTLFTFILFCDLYAFYRIQKLRRSLLIVVFPNAILSTTIASIFADFNCEPDWWLVLIGYDDCLFYGVNVLIGIIYGGFLVFSIYLVRKWSKEWNLREIRNE